MAANTSFAPTLREQLGAGSDIRAGGAMIVARSALARVRALEGALRANGDIESADEIYACGCSIGRVINHVGGCNGQ